MALRSQFGKMVLGIAMLSAMPHSAHADVKAGVDAWSRGDFEDAVKQWREAALKGDADAQFNMGQAYKVGRGVETDLNVALDWYKRAAAQGHLQASDSYGHLLHYQGKVAEALPSLQASAERGDPRAQYLLGTELFNGVHIEKDWVRAYALMMRASSAGMGPASRSLTQMDKYVSLEQRQRAALLAGQIEQRSTQVRTAEVSGFPTNPPSKATKPVTVPRTNSPPVAAADIPVAPAKPAVEKPTPVRAVKVDGKWRIQLGAFGNEGNAKKLWTTLESKIADLAELQPYLKTTGNLTRLQAGPFATRSAADAMCVKVQAIGQACISVDR